MTARLVPLALIAAQRQITWGQAYSMLLSGKLGPARRIGSRWFVEVPETESPKPPEAA